MSNPGQPLPNHKANPVVAKAYWDHIGEMAKFTNQVQADYGKWLIVTVTSVHLAALYMVSQPGVPETVRYDSMSYWPFVIGICAILIAGLITWANWTISGSTYVKWRHPFMLVDPAFWPVDLPKWKRNLHIFTFWASLLIGIFSAACLPWGAYEILQHVKPAPVVVVAPVKIAVPTPPGVPPKPAPSQTPAK